MLNLPLTNPPLLAALARAGHGAKVLLADGNYPATTAAHPRAERIELSIGRDLPTVSSLLPLLLASCPVEAAQLMAADDRVQTAAHQEFITALSPIVPEALDRHAFYSAARDENLAVVVTTGDSRPYANLLLTVGVA